MVPERLPITHPATLQIMAGQGTTALELLEQLQAAQQPAPDVVLVPVGGGGLIGGMAAALKHV